VLVAVFCRNDIARSRFFLSWRKISLIAPLGTLKTIRARVESSRIPGARGKRPGRSRSACVHAAILHCFLLIAADETRPCGNTKRDELFDGRAPPSRTAHHARRLLKDSPISGTNRFRRHSSHQLRATFMNRSFNMWPKRATLSSAVGAFSKDEPVGKTHAQRRLNGFECRGHPRSWQMRHIEEAGVTEAPQMAFNDNAEHVRILSSVRKGIDGLRRRMQ
jgi:hypothetical protein